MIRVVIADDHRVVRTAIAGMLQTEPDIEIVGQAADGQEVVEITQRLQPHVVVMDINMPRKTGLEAAREILSTCPGVRIVGLSMCDGGAIGESLIELGASDYVQKDWSLGRLLVAIRAAAAGE